MRSPHVTGNVCRRFPNQLEVAQHRVIAKSIGNERLLVQSLRIADHLSAKSIVSWT